MFDLNLVYVQQEDREREVAADLRRRQLLGARRDPVVRAGRPVIATFAPARPRVRADVAGR